ncbi:hypothetical protein GCM10020220_115940 [Nonomuraea rubra]
MTLVLAFNNVRANRMGVAASFAAVLLAVTLVAGGGLVVAAAAGRDDLNGVMGLLVLSAVVSGFVAVFVVAGTLSLHVLRQRRTWGLLRSVGMTPRQVRRLVTAEALVVAVLASAAGCVLAVPYAVLMAGFVRVTGLAPAGVQVRVTAGPFVLALVAGLVVTLLAARVAARKAVRVGPLEVLRDSAAQERLLPWPRAVAGVVALVGGGVLVFLVPRLEPADAVPAGLGAAMVLCVGASALGPVVLRGIGRLLGAVVAGLDPGAGMLARASLVAQPAPGDVGGVTGDADRGARVHLPVRRDDVRRGGGRHPYGGVGVGRPDPGGVGGDLHRDLGAQRDRDDDDRTGRGAQAAADGGDRAAAAHQGGGLGDADRDRRGGADRNGHRRRLPHRARPGRHRPALVRLLAAAVRRAGAGLRRQRAGGRAGRHPAGASRLPAARSVTGPVRAQPVGVPGAAGRS